MWMGLVQPLPLARQALCPGLASPAGTPDAQPAASWCWGEALEGAGGRVLRCHPAARGQLSACLGPGRATRLSKSLYCYVLGGGGGGACVAASWGLWPAAVARGKGYPPHTLGQGWQALPGPGFGSPRAVVLTRHLPTLCGCAVSSRFLSCFHLRSLAAPRRASREACRAAESGR